MSTPSPRWFKSSHSGAQEGNCVETARLGAPIGIRDSKDLTIGHLEVQSAAWVALITGLAGT
ncbi:DUF397 domain-containing protein [Streptomyces sp. SID3343]|uniref:DUF397 domain-containing protein n=1 Tax=Streptomyces sp. SID3343 TaxID=2690260 RepID=UPI0013705B0B|nr:DUF397 domain-containing protein [Streptomyces sp. SID3343]MYW02445.1 DUF397 domain-containing protein [Streptomyces sp. SID3343]